jgi:hypothetical protein
MGRDGDAPGDAPGDFPSDALRLRDDLITGTRTAGNTNGGNERKHTNGTRMEGTICGKVTLIQTIICAWQDEDVALSA